MTQELETKVKQALKLLQSCSRSAGKPLEILYNKLNKTTNYGKQQLLPSVLSHNPTLVREQLIPIVKLVDAIIQEEKPAILRPDSEEGKEDKA